MRLETANAVLLLTGSLKQQLFTLGRATRDVQTIDHSDFGAAVDTVKTIESLIKQEVAHGLGCVRDEGR